MLSQRIDSQIERLLLQTEKAWESGCWATTSDLAQQVLDLEPVNADARVYFQAAKRRGAREIQQVAYSLDCFPVICFITDGLNRIQWVNRSFIATIGDPSKDQLEGLNRFVPAAIAGPYRDKFPRWKDEISTCLAGLHREVEAGNLVPGTLQLIEQTIQSDSELCAAAKKEQPWDGTMVVRSEDGKSMLVREQVLPIVDGGGQSIGFHATLWCPTEAEVPSLPDTSSDLVSDVLKLLTSRQLEIAQLYASGLTSRRCGFGRHKPADC